MEKQGVDDALNLFLMMLSPEVDLRAITLVRGNTDIENAKRNAVTCLEAVYKQYTYFNLSIPSSLPVLAVGKSIHNSEKNKISNQSFSPPFSNKFYRCSVVFKIHDFLYFCTGQDNPLNPDFSKGSDGFMGTDGLGDIFTLVLRSIFTFLVITVFFLF